MAAPAGTARRGRAAAPGRVVARRELPVRRARSTCSTTRCCASRCARARQAAAARPLGHDAGPELPLRPPQPRHPRATTSTRSSSPGPGTAGPGSSPTPTSRAPTARSTRASTRDEEGMRRLFRQFSFPGGIPSHVAPETPGSIHEGGELGYALVHAYGAAFDNPDLLVCCVVGDGEAETGPLAASWHSNKFLEPGARRRGAADPAPQRLQDRQPDRAGADPARRAARAAARLRPRAATSSRATTRRPMHQLMAADARRGRRRDRARSRRGRARAATRAAALADDRAAHAEGLDRARRRSTASRSRARSARTRCRWRSSPTTPSTSRALEAWMRSLPAGGALRRRRARSRAELAALAPDGRAPHGRQPARQRRPAAARPARCPTSATTPSTSPRPATTTQRGHARARRLPARRHARQRRRAQLPRLRARTRPPRTGSARSSRSPTARGWPSAADGDDHLAPDGRVMEVLSEHLCQGWLEGYLLTGRHGLFNCYEAFIHIVDSMFNQHAKWLKVTRDDPVAAADRVAELPAVARTSGARTTTASPTRTPGFIDHVVNKKAEIIRVYLPPDANMPAVGRPTTACAAATTSTSIVAGKQPALDYLTMDEAIAHCTRGIGIWDWASNDDGDEPDVVLACAGDIPTLETLAAAALLREHLPELKVRVVNVVDLMRLQADERAPARPLRPRVRRALHRRQAGDLRLPRLPVADPPPHLPAHQPPQPPRARLQGGGHDHDAVRHGHAQRHGPLPPGDRRHRPRARARAARRRTLRQQMVDERLRHRAYTREHGDDPPEVRDWTWPGGGAA